MQKLTWTEHKIIDRTTLVRRIAGWRNTGRRIVFTNGCFDILHRGHIELLAQAAAFGDALVIGLNTDASVQRLKGPQRPINKEHDRALCLAALMYTDAICLFDEDTPLELIEAVRPDVLVKGGDYTIDTIVGAKETIAHGGSVEIVPVVSGYSTTGINERMK